MRSALSHKFADTVVPFLKFCGWSALTIGAGAAVSNTPTLLNDVLTDQAIEGLKSFSVVLGAASGFAGNRVGDYYKECREKLKLSINGDLEKALKKALLRTTDTVCDQYIQTKKIVGDQEVLVRQFFKELKGQLDAVVVEDHHIEEYAKNRDFFLHIFTQGRGFSGLDSDEDLVRFLTQEFPKEVTHAFLKELKGNPKAQIVYHTLLLEMSVQQGQLSNKTLQVLQADLLRLADNSENVQEQMHRIYHLLQLIQQALVKQNIDLSARFRQLENLLKDTSQPSLTDYSQDYKQVDARFQYNYKTGYTTFIARQPELEQVEAFVLPDAGQRFRWWLLTGPGGMGKSRLAQEVCLRFNPYETWYAGFLDKKQLSDFSWHTWLPKHHTLIVVDYVSTRAQDVEYMLTKLHERSSTFDKSVRVLLLERDTNGSWWDTLQKSMGASKSQYAEPLALLPFTDDDRWQIIEEVHRKVTDEHRRIGKPLPDKLRDRVQTLEKLAELDPKNRPLFAFFVGMALAAGKTIRDWDVNQLLEHILDEHERKRWRESTDELLLQKHERLLALATITRGLTSTHWRTLQKIKDPVLPDTLDRNLYHRMAGVADSAGDKQYLPLEPDILGEFLVKQTFEALLNDDNYDPDTVQKLIWLAWQFRPDETWAFAERLLGDFPKTTFCSCFWAPLPSDLWTTLPVDRSLEIALTWSRFQVNLTHPVYFFAHTRLEDLLEKYTQVEQLRQQPGLSDNVELAVEQASAAMNLTNRLGAHKENLGLAQTYYQKIVELRQQPGLSDNVELAVEQASAAMNLTGRLGAHKEHLELVQTYYDRIGVLASEFKTLAIIQVLSRATRILFKHYITHLRDEAVDQASALEQINELIRQSSHLNNIGKEIDAPYLQIEFGIVVFTLLTEPIADYSPEQVQAWQQILYYLLQNFADYPDESWQNYWQPELLRYFQWLSDSASKPEETDESSTDK